MTIRFLPVVWMMATTLVVRGQYKNRQWIKEDKFGKVLPTAFYRSKRGSYSTVDATDCITVDRTSCRSFQILDIPRGGGDGIAIDVAQKDDMDGIFIQKLKNVVRSVIRISKRSPILHNSLVSLIKLLESSIGVQLMPEPASKKKKKSNRKARKSVKKEKGAVDDEVESATMRTKKSTKTKGTNKKRSTVSSIQVKKDLKATSPNYRIQQELKSFILDPPEHLSVKTGKNIRIWIVSMQGIGIYQGETFRLRIQFPNQYPTVPPSVYFLPPNIPIHEHVYTNGDICLSLLGKDWRPTMTAQSVAHSILSILASATSKSLPMDNARHAGNQPGQYQENWVYHDDNC
jgi:ubiquitin-conjugating enzyme E2 W